MSVSGNAQLIIYLETAYRRRWWVVVPLVLSIAASWLVLLRLPKIYRATTTILVTPQRLPEEFVRTTVTTEVQERVAALAVQVLSRTYLEKVVREFGMVPADADDAVVDQLCLRVKRNVGLNYDVRNLSWFTINVEDAIPVRAAGIANRLAELFIEENSLLRQEQATGARDTVEVWLSERKSELDKKEAQIAEFTQTYLWELPERLQVNLQLMSSARERMMATINEIQSREARLTSLRVQAQTEDVLTRVEIGLSAAGRPESRTMDQLKRELAELRARYTEDNPVVRAKLAEVKEFERLEALSSPIEEDAAVEPAPSIGAAESEIAQIQSEIATLQTDREALQLEIDKFTHRIEMTPLREQEYSALTRDLETLQRIYNELLAMKEQAVRAEDLESTRKSEQFQIQDRARIPSIPFKPNSSMVIALCVMAGLGVGVGASVLMEFLNQTVKTEEEFQAAFPELALLGTIENLDGRGRSRHRKSRRKRGRKIAVLLIAPILATLLGGISIW